MGPHATKGRGESDSARRARPWSWMAAGAIALLAIGIAIRPSQKLSVQPGAEPPPSKERDIAGDKDSAARRPGGSSIGTAATFRHDPQPGRREVKFRLFESLPGIDAEADPMTREELMLAAVEDVAVVEMQAALAALQNVEQTPVVTDLSVRLVRRWAENDPQAAAACVVQMPEGPLRSESIDQAAIAWANHNFPEAAGWARQLPDGNERLQALRAVIYETVRAEPAEALRLAIELDAHPERDRVIQQAAREWAIQRPVDATRWAREIPDAALRAQVLATAALAWGEHDAWEAGRMAVDELPAGRLQADTVVGIAQRWAQRDPEQTAAWIEQFPPGELKRAAANSVAAIWSLRDAARAQYWRGQLAVNLPLTDISANQTKP